jgi:hypothetical protein
VTNQVNNVANRAWVIGEKVLKKSRIIKPPPIFSKLKIFIKPINSDPYI